MSPSTLKCIHMWEREWELARQAETGERERGEKKVTSQVKERRRERERKSQTAWMQNKPIIINKKTCNCVFVWVSAWGSIFTVLTATGHLFSGEANEKKDIQFKTYHCTFYLLTLAFFFFFYWLVSSLNETCNLRDILLSSSLSSTCSCTHSHCIL